jgi:hypothetical protein
LFTTTDDDLGRFRAGVGAFRWSPSFAAEVLLSGSLVDFDATFVEVGLGTFRSSLPFEAIFFVSSERSEFDSGARLIVAFDVCFFGASDGRFPCDGGDGGFVCFGSFFSSTFGVPPLSGFPVDSAEVTPAIIWIRKKHQHAQKIKSRDPPLQRQE